ncbi:hypothetical protein CANCADRAFT_23601 [Tortispora caseinolytica NRRL Y-17796]|uniref:ABC transporter domain-containing protein n=1 Tax=Tortispora caseinolytica NRRL Y-17796 TaxID=767744 RepID=A0A1E4TKV0_9ASCO|nr:hypothetical protein CANCADRAFT_23601 [Tortispora caseinolytica NRRL Y-17796]
MSLKEVTKGIDPVISNYANGYLEYIHQNLEDIKNTDSIDKEIDFVKLVLQSSGCDNTKLDKLCNEYAAKLKSEFDAKSALNTSASKQLKQSLVIGSQRITNASALLGHSTDLDAVSGKRIKSQVDKKKLAKAEKKIRAKMEKRENESKISVAYESSKLLNESDEDYDDFFKTVNPYQSSSARAKSKDVKIDSFDLYVGNGLRILSGAQLVLAHGHRYGLVGHNGIGKSSLLKALSRRELPIPENITILHVEQEVRGDEVPALQSVLDADVWRKHFLQEQTAITARLNELESAQDDTENDVLAQKMRDDEIQELQESLNVIHENLADMDADTAESRAATILSGLGFSVEAQSKPTNQFSGGWRMRLALARALFCKPDLLLLDEPSNMLDVPSITFLADYLQTYPGTVLIVSHDRAFLNDVATDIIHQHSERLDYYRGCDFDRFYASKEERRKNQQREYDNQMAYRKHLQTFIDKFRYNAAKSSEAQSRIKKLEKLPVLEPPEEEQEFKFRFTEVEKLSPPIIQLQNVTFGYNPDKAIVRDVDLSIQLDSRIALVGGNGSGKTTLLRLLIGQLEASKGQISRNGRLRIGYFAQHHVDQMDLNLTAVSWLAKVWPGKSDEEYRRHLGSFGITGTLGVQKLELLSGGQKSRVAFACLCLNQPHILVLDEPSNHLDTAGLDALADALKKFEGGVLMVSHDVTLISQVCNEIWSCEEGHVNQFDGDIFDYKKYILAKAGSSGIVVQH